MRRKSKGFGPLRVALEIWQAQNNIKSVALHSKKHKSIALHFREVMFLSCSKQFQCNVGQEIGCISITKKIGGQLQNVCLSCTFYGQHGSAQTDVPGNEQQSLVHLAAHYLALLTFSATDSLEKLATMLADSLDPVPFNQLHNRVLCMFSFICTDSLQ